MNPYFVLDFCSTKPGQHQDGFNSFPILDAKSQDGIALNVWVFCLKPPCMGLLKKTQSGMFYNFSFTCVYVCLCDMFVILCVDVA